MKGSSVFLSFVVAGIVMMMVSALAMALIDLAGGYYYVTVPVVVCSELFCKVVATIDVSWVDIFANVGLFGFMLAIVSNIIRHFLRKKELGL